MTANDSQTPGRIPAPATRPRSGAEPQFGRVGIEFTSPNAGRVDGPARETLAPQGIQTRRGGGDPPRPVRPAERPVHSQPCRCARSVCWEQGRSAAWPMPFRPGNPSTICGPYFGPHLPPAQRAFPTSESFCVRHGRRPTRPPAGCYALHGPTKPSAPTRHAVAAPTRVATAMRPSSPVGCMLEGGQPIRLGTQRNHRPNRPHRYSHFPSDLKVRPPAGGRRLIRPAHEAARAVCMYDVAGAAPRPRDRRALQMAPGGQRSAK
jgi:hypothetical protein